MKSDGRKQEFGRERRDAYRDRDREKQKNRDMRRDLDKGKEREDKSRERLPNRTSYAPTNPVTRERVDRAQVEARPSRVVPQGPAVPGSLAADAARILRERAEKRHLEQRMGDEVHSGSGTDDAQDGIEGDEEEPGELPRKRRRHAPIVWRTPPKGFMPAEAAAGREATSAEPKDTASHAASLSPLELPPPPPGVLPQAPARASQTGSPFGLLDRRLGETEGALSGPHLGPSPAASDEKGIAGGDVAESERPSRVASRWLTEETNEEEESAREEALEGEEALRQLNEKEMRELEEAPPPAVVEEEVDELEASEEEPEVPVSPTSHLNRAISMLQECRNVDEEFEKTSRISEGTYGVVYCAKEKKTGRICALKKVKMDKEKDGFPLTSIREINILLSFHHPNIVNVSEVVVGNSLDSVFMVMEFMEHDLKAVMEVMPAPFTVAETKTLMSQLLSGIAYLHQNWVLHRDLKTSNILYNNRGELKICDFGLARQYGSPLRPYTQMVVTLWYRAPELLLGGQTYSTAVDMWSLGCIMAELLLKEVLFDGKSELDQLDRIFQLLGTPNERIWEGYSKLPNASKVNFKPQPYNKLRDKFPDPSAMDFANRPRLTEAGFDLLNRLLALNPAKRISAQEALQHPWFNEPPLQKDKALMPTFPTSKDGSKRARLHARLQPSPDPRAAEVRREKLALEQAAGGGLFSFNPSRR